MHRPDHHHPRPLQVGDSARRSRRVTHADIERFTELTGDRNPIHYDAALAATSRFGGIIVQGGVTSGLLNAVVAEDLPGRRDTPRRLLGVWAHPDDETYLSAALMHRVTASGGHVTVVSATCGELGGDAPDVGADLGRRRRAELVDAMGELGVRDVRVLGHADGSCAGADPRSAARDLERIIDAVRPDTIITFGPDGITGHPDHVAVGRWTTLAVVRLAAAAGGRADSPNLLYATMTHEFVARHGTSYPELPLTVAGSPVSVARHQVSLWIEPTVVERRHKRAALDAHVSQVAPLAALVGPDRLHDWWRDETFRVPTASDLHQFADRHRVSTTSPGALQASPPVLAHSGTTSDHVGGRHTENRDR